MSTPFIALFTNFLKLLNIYLTSLGEVGKEVGALRSPLRLSIRVGLHRDIEVQDERGASPSFRASAAAQGNAGASGFTLG